MTYALAVLALAAADQTARTITGTATIYGQRAHANYPLEFVPGSIRLPDPVTRVKLTNDNHDRTAPVGYATAATDDGDRLTMTFHVPETPAGDDALRDAALGLRDGLSVGVDLDDDGYHFDDDGYLIVTGGMLREVTLTGVPAMDDARLDAVMATLRTTATKGTTTMKCQTCGHVHAADAPCVQAPPTPTPEATGTPATPPTPPSAEATAPQAPAPTPQAPAPTPPATTDTRRTMSLRAACNLVSQTLRNGGTSHDVRAVLGMQAVAALSDVIPANDAGEGLLRPTFLGELWRASRVDRPMIDTLGVRELTGMKLYGWRWDTRPVVATYTGNKTEVPSNEVATVAAEATASRLAGGWDVDRIYVDLGEPGMIEALFEAAVQDYRIKTEAAVVTALLAGASSVTAQTTLAGALVAIGSASAALGARVQALAFGATVWSDFTSLTRDQVPWWLGGAGDSVNIGDVTGTVGGVRLFHSPTLGANDVLAVDPRGATYAELNPPVRVQAQDIAHGGVDLGVFGYQALLINDPRVIIKTTVTAPAA